MRARQRHLKPKSIGAFIALDSRYINQSDNTAVSSWADISGNSNNADQANATFQPTFQTAELGGNGVVRFDGSNDFLETPTITKNQPYTSFVIVYPRQTYAGGYNQFFEDTTLGCLILIWPTLKWAAYAGTNLNNAGTAVLNAWALNSAVFNGSSSSISFNGTTTTGNAGANNINGKFQVGRAYNDGFRTNNDLAVSMVCQGAFSNSLRKKIERNLAYSFKLPCS